MSGEIMVKPKKLTILNLFMIVAGSILYAAGINLFLVPLHLYAGGIPGLSQVLRTLFFAHVSAVDAAGIINLILNIPLFLLVSRTMRKKLILGTLLSVAVQTLVFTLWQGAAKPLLDDTLASILAAGILGGIGCGIILTNGGSGGGMDLLGVYMAQHLHRFSVGRMNLLFNAVLYSFMAVYFDLQTALYSVIYIAVFSVTIDRWHYQNIEVELMIFTHSKEVKHRIMEDYARGVTCWNGAGAYTGQETEILVTIISKSEVEAVKRTVRSADPNAFIIEHTRVNVSGGYQKRLS